MSEGYRRKHVVKIHKVNDYSSCLLGVLSDQRRYSINSGQKTAK